MSVMSAVTQKVWLSKRNAMDACRILDGDWVVGKLYGYYRVFRSGDVPDGTKNCVSVRGERLS